MAWTLLARARHSYFMSFCTLVALFARGSVSFFVLPLSVSQLPSEVANCKVVGCASSVGLLPAALGPSFLDKGVGTGPTATQFGLACAQTMPSLPGTCLRQAEPFQMSCGRQT